MPTPFEATTEELDGPVHQISVVGELGYEINCSAVEHARLRKILLEEIGRAHV